MSRTRSSLASLFIAGLLATASSVSALEWKDGVLQPLADGFPNQPITLVNVDEAGSNGGLYIRALQDALKDKSPVEIRISDEPRAAGGTINTLAEIAEDREGGSDGYFAVCGSLIGSATDFLGEPITEETGYTIEDVNFLISTEQIPWIFAQRTDVPWGQDFGKFVEYAKANPGKVKYIAPGVGSGTDIYMTWMLDQLGLEVVKVPAEDRQAASAAVGGGEGDITMTQPAVLLAAGDRMKALMVSTSTVPDAFAGAASSADYEKFGIDNLSWGTNNMLMIPATVPAEHAEWLYALVASVVDSDSYKKRAETIPGLTVGLLTNAEANDFARKAMAAADPIVRKAGLHWEQNR